MKVYFLGTGTSQGIPVIGSNHSVCLSNDPKDKRLRVSIWIQDVDFSVVVDCGPDFRQQMLTSKCSHLDALLFTHEHADHTAGLDDIRPFYFNQGDIPIYAHLRVLDNLSRRFDYIFNTENKYPGTPSVQSFPIENNQSFNVKHKTIVPINAMHGNLQVFGFRVGDFAYLTDVKTIEPAEVLKLQGVKVLVVNALREEEHHSHFSLKEALNFIDLVQPEKAYLTHISHIFGFHNAIQAKLPPHVFVAYDNLELVI